MWDTTSGLHRSLSWRPTSEDGDGLPFERLLPELAGHLHLVGKPGKRSLVLDGSVEPPLGVVGAALDSVLLHRVADATAAAFLRDVAARITCATSLPV